MKLAIIGSRELYPTNIESFIPQGVSEIVSGGAKGVDGCAAKYAKENDIPLTVFLPDYSRYRKAAPLKRNQLIAQYANAALVFWDGSSRGTKYTIDQFRKLGKPVNVILLPSDKKILP